MRMLGASLVVLFSLVSVTHAGPLDLKQVAADAQWVVHSDADLMRTSPVIEKSYQAMAEEWPDQLEGHMDSLHDDFGIDMQNGMHSMTIYGKKLGKPTGVLIAHVDVNKELLEGKLKEAAGYEAVEHGKHTVHCFDAGERGPMALMFYAPTTLIVGRGAGDVSAAADVLDGKAPNITSKKKSPLAAKVPADAMLVARGVGLSEADLPVKSAAAEAVRFGLPLVRHQGRRGLSGRRAGGQDRRGGAHDSEHFRRLAHCSPPETGQRPGGGQAVEHVYAEGLGQEGDCQLAGLGRRTVDPGRNHLFAVEEQAVAAAEKEPSCETAAPAVLGASHSGGRLCYSGTGNCP